MLKLLEFIFWTVLTVGVIIGIVTIGRILLGAANKFARFFEMLFQM